MHAPFDQSIAGTVPTFRKRLLAWYDAEKRVLPFRDIADPYGVLVSEIMLQQTQVDRVCDFWQRFMARFPTAHALADAPEEAVLAAWEGLGYYRRARFLHAAAKRIVSDFGGKVPRDPAALATLPGLGAYTTASVSSIAYGEPLAVVDANVVRVVARLCAFAGDPTTAPVKAALAAGAQAFLDCKRPGDWNQAMMELGALICSPVSPGCAHCPVRAHCRALATGEPERFPARAASARIHTRHEAAIVLASERGFLFEQRPSSGLWPNLWTFPFVTLAEGARPADAARHLLAAWGLDVPLGAAHRTAYAVTTRRVTLTYHIVRLGAKARPSLPEGGAFRWSPDGTNLALAAPHRRILAGMLAQPEQT